MTISITHLKVSGASDGANSQHVQPSDWNAALATSMATARLIGRTTASTGAFEEISVASTLTFSGGVLGANTSQIPRFTVGNTWANTQVFRDITLTKEETANQAPSIGFFRGRAGPTAVQANDRLGEFGGFGHDGLNYDTSQLDVMLRFFAAENFSNTAHGTYMDMATITGGTLTRSTRMRVKEGVYHPSAAGGDKGDNTINYGGVYAGQLFMQGSITPTSFSTAQNNYAPTGHDTAGIFKLTTTGSPEITGLSGGVDGRIVYLHHNKSGANAIWIRHENASSTAANRFDLVSATDAFIEPGHAMAFFYDGTASRWKPLDMLWTWASKASQEAGTEWRYFTSPWSQHWHPSAAKCWVQGQTGTTTILSSYNITSLGNTGTGQQTVTIATDFSSANYCVQVTVGDTSTALVKSSTVMTKAAGSYIMNSVVEAGSGSNPSNDWNSVAFGDQ